MTNAETAIRNLEREVSALAASNQEWRDSMFDQLEEIDAKLNPIVTLVAEYRGGAKVIRVLLSALLVAVGAFIKGYWTKVVGFFGS